MKYTVTLKHKKTGEVLPIPVCAATAKDAAEGQEHHKLWEFVSVSPLEDCPGFTARQVYDMPSLNVYVADPVNNAVTFVNLMSQTDLPEYGSAYNDAAIASEGRLKVERKVYINYDGERTTSLYVIIFDDYNIGFYMAAGRGERDRVDSVLTDYIGAMLLKDYLLRHYNDPSPTIQPHQYGLNEKVPYLYDWMQDYRDEFGL